ncbi:GxxExxY protein [Candidatus Acetothermia bacterium]|nr:GxxExxY protein [Candidatus Acetothermia bacterium]
MANKHDLSQSDITGRILKCAVEVHKTLGPGFQEIVYQRALAQEFEAEGLQFAREEWIPIFYKGEKLDTRRVDFLVEDIIVELKAKASLEDIDFIQTLSYLKALGYHVALLLNFGTQRLQSKRLVYDLNRRGH